jgi:hypothetical protein
MKDDILYEDYIDYLKYRLERNQISNGKFHLLKISESNFHSFKEKLENDEHFRDNFLKIKILENRDKKIDDIFDDLD